MILFAISLPDVGAEGSENIFYSCFLTLCEVKQIEFSSLQRSILQSHIVDKNRVEKLKEVLAGAYGGYNND